MAQSKYEVSLRNAIEDELIEDDEINILEYLQVLQKNIGWIILVTVLTAVCTMVFTKVVLTPTYRSQFTAYVNNRANSTEAVSTVTNADLTAAQSLVKTYSEIITSSSVLEAAASECNVDMEYSALEKMVETEIPSGTELIAVYVEAYTPAQAQRLAQAIAEQAQTQIADIVDGTSMRIVDQPSLPKTVYAPNYLKITIFAAIISAFLTCVVIIIQHSLDDEVRDEETLREKYDIPILGIVPNYDSALLESQRGSYGYGYGYGHRGERSARSSKHGAGRKARKNSDDSEENAQTEIEFVNDFWERNGE